MIDWRALLARYVAVVMCLEGATFLRQEDWTPEEWALLADAQRDAQALELDVLW